jgi:3-dehydroquinate synthetase
MKRIANDKKRIGGLIDAIFVNEIGKCEIIKMVVSELEKIIRNNIGGKE